MIVRRDYKVTYFQERFKERLFQLDYQKLVPAEVIPPRTIERSPPLPFPTQLQVRRGILDDMDEDTMVLQGKALP